MPRREVQEVTEQLAEFLVKFRPFKACKSFKRIIKDLRGGLSSVASSDEQYEILVPFLSSLLGASTIDFKRYRGAMMKHLPGPKTALSASKEVEPHIDEARKFIWPL